MAKKKKPEHKILNTFEIEKNLVISTAHIPEEDFLKAEKQAQNDRSKVFNGYPELMVENHTYGVIVILGSSDKRSDMIQALRKDFSEAFCNVLSLASSMELDNVKFDADGPEYDCLPTFGW